MTGEQVRARMQPRLAWQALRKLIADPEDTAQVFTIVRAMSGPSLQRGYRRFARLPTGRRVIDREIDLLRIHIGDAKVVELERQIEKVAAPGSSTNDDSLTRDPGPIFKLDARDVI